MILTNIFIFIFLWLKSECLCRTFTCVNGPDSDMMEELGSYYDRILKHNKPNEPTVFHHWMRDSAGL